MTSEIMDVPAPLAACRLFTTGPTSASDFFFATRSTGGGRRTEALDLEDLEVELGAVHSGVWRGGEKEEWQEVENERGVPFEEDDWEYCRRWLSRGSAFGAYQRTQVVTYELLS
jgi:hypothetical protein